MSPPPDEDSHMDSADDRVADEDAFAAALSGSPEVLDQANDADPYFHSIACRVYEASGIKEGKKFTVAGFAGDCYKMWHDFTTCTFTPHETVPPPAHIDEAFLMFCRNRLGKDLLLRKVAIGHLGGSTYYLPPSCAQAPKAPAPLLAPQVTSLGDRQSAPIDVPSDSNPSHPVSIPGPAFNGWHITGKKGKQSWAAVAAAASKPPPVTPKHLPPTHDHATSGFVTCPQLESLTKQTIVSLFNSRFPTGPRIPRNTSKEVAVTTFLLRMQEPMPSTSTHVSPPPKVISKTEFTLSQDPCSPAPSGPRGDAASLVRQVQGLIRSSGANVKAELIGRCWSSQSSCNFVLVFNGNPTYEAVLSLQHIFAHVFGLAYGLTPACGYTWVILNLVPTMQDTPSSPLPMAQELRYKLACNDVCRALLIFGNPYWLTARTEGSCHSSISFAFLDKDGLRTQSMIHNPPYMFGNRTLKVRKYVSRPLLSECLRCLRLGHTAQRCCSSPSVIICPICGNSHKEDEHDAKCPNVSKHVGVSCSCPPVCINCVRAKKPTAKGHLASSAACLLWALFRSSSPPARASSGGTSAPTSAACIDDDL